MVNQRLSATGWVKQTKNTTADDGWVDFLIQAVQNTVPDQATSRKTKSPLSLACVFRLPAWVFFRSRFKLTLCSQNGQTKDWPKTSDQKQMLI